MRVKRFWNWETPPDQNIESNNPDGVSVRVLRALHNRGCSRGLNPPTSRRLRAM